GVIHFLDCVVVLDGGAGRVIDFLVQDIEGEVGGKIGQPAFDQGKPAAVKIGAPEGIAGAIEQKQFSIQAIHRHRRATVQFIAVNAGSGEQRRLAAAVGG